jgi:hypothetical protein
LSSSFGSQSHSEFKFLFPSSVDPSTLQLLCKQFYQYADRFESLRFLDCTNVPLDDDCLRYFIRLFHLESLGLSGTNISTKGIKYLAKHAEFKSSLKCLKLCYIQNLTDDLFPHLGQFDALADLDLLGCTQITLKGVLQLVNHPSMDRNIDDETLRVITCDQRSPVKLKVPLQQLRLPHPLFSQLLTVHSAYQSLRSQSLIPSSELICDPELVSKLSRPELIAQLKKHKLHYPDIYLNLQREELAAKLEFILSMRLKEERIWNLL